MTQMLYKSPGQHDWPQHGGTFDYIVVPESGIDQAVSDGWFMTTAEALAAVGDLMPDLITHEIEPPIAPKPKRKYTRKPKASN